MADHFLIAFSNDVHGLNNPGITHTHLLKLEESLVSALMATVGSNPVVLTVTATLISPTKWRVEHKFVTPPIEGTTVYLALEDGSALEYLNEQKIVRFHRSGRALLADALRGIPEVMTASLLANLTLSDIAYDPDISVLTFKGRDQGFTYALNINPESFRVEEMRETAGDQLLREISRNNTATESKQFIPGTTSVMQTQEWIVDSAGIVTNFVAEEFSPKLPDGYMFELPSDHGGYRSIPLQGFRELIFHNE